MAASSLTFCAVFFLTAVAPAVALAACLFVFMLQCAVLAVRMLAALPQPVIEASTPAGSQPVFSVHLPVHSEPPAVVIKTIGALVWQSWPQSEYEIIVIDNNTNDPALWRPVQRYCDKLGGNVRFLHRTGVADAKAGALNIALCETRADATHVVLVDADYVSSSGFLAAAAAALAAKGAGFIQFPQAYRNGGSSALGVEAELAEYFLTDARQADSAVAVLPTGTMCAISRSALEHAGGWSGRTSTEDAELGVRLCMAGYSGRYISSVAGKGLLPLNLNGLIQQRSRWCRGNLKTLITHARTLCRRAVGLKTRQRLVIAAQLTSWLNFALVPAAALLSTAFVSSPVTLTGQLSAWMVALAAVSPVCRIALRCWQKRVPVPVFLEAAATRIAMMPASARAAVDGMFDVNQKFRITGKDCHSASGGDPVPLDHTLVFILAACALAAGVAESAIAYCALVLLLLPLPAALWTRRSLRLYRNGMAIRQTGAI